MAIEGGEQPDSPTGAERTVDVTSSKSSGSTGGPVTDQTKRRGLVEILVDLWHQKPGTRVPNERVDSRTIKQVVDGLDHWELRLAIGATALEAVLTPFVYWYWRTHGDATVRRGALEFLVTGFISVGLLLLGTVLKRRALVGFAAFMTGFGWFTYRNLLLALVYLVFGGWLIMRVMRKQKQDKAAGKPTESFGPGSRGGQRKSPTASKRYTPPRRAPARKAAQGPRR